jgi:outer membrane receptor for ferrienterochelin and colicins
MRFRILVLALLLTQTLDAQIQLFSSLDSSAVPYAKIAYRSLESTSFEFTQTDSSGYFKLGKTNNDPIELRIQLIGFESYLDTLLISETKKIFLKSNTNLNVVCVTTQYQPTTLANSVQKITVISADQIQKSGAITLADIINYQTGIRISQDNILGSSMSIGGISGENVKILIDGVPVIGRLNGSVDLSQINLNNVERIEMIEGPLSVNYGTNALGGTINLISKKQDKRGVHLELNPYYENIGNYNFNVTSTLSMKKNSFTISGGRNYFDGWKSIEKFIQFPKETLADTNRFLTWKPKEQYFAEVRYNANFNGWTINPYLRYFDETIVNRGFPKAPYYESSFDDYYHTLRGDGGIILNKNFNRYRMNTIVAYNYFQRIKNTYLNDLTTLNPILSETAGAQDTSRFSLINFRSTFNSTKGKKFNYEFGLDINHEMAYGVRIENVEQTMGDYALFATSEWKPFENFIVKPGLRYAYNTVYQAPIIPSVHLHYKKENWILRSSFARGFRAPSLKELYFDFVDINHNIQGNQDLLAESSLNYNLGIAWMKQTKKNLFFKVDLTAYYNDIQNLITLGLASSNSYTYINIGEYKTIGNNLALTLRHKRFSLLVNSSYIGRYNLISEESDVNPFTFSPEVGTQFSFYLFKEKLSLNAFYKFTGRLQTFYLDANDIIVTSTQDHYQILDVSFNLKLLENKLVITAGAKNIFNVTSIAITGQTGGIHSGDSKLNTARGTSVFIGIHYRLDFNFKDEHEK